MRIALITETRKTSLSFSNLCFDPFLGVVVMLVLFINFGINCSFFKALNIINNESFKSVPITSILNISLINPSGSLDLLFFKFLRASRHAKSLFLSENQVLALIKSRQFF